MLIVAGEQGVFSLDDKAKRGEPQLCGKRFMAMALAARTGRIALSVYKDGVFVSDDRGHTWDEITGDLPYRDVRALCFDNQDSPTLYAGTEPAAVFRRENGTASWQPCGDVRALPEAKDWSFPVPPKIAHVRTIEVSPVDPSLLYVGIEVGSYLISRDGGENWSVASGVGHDLHRTVIHPSRPQRLLVATGLDTGAYRGCFGLYRSDDDGATWIQVNEGLGHRLYTEDAIAVDVEDPDTYFVAAAHGIPPKWASVVQLLTGIFSGNVYFLSPSRLRRRKGADVTVFRSRDAGDHWHPVPDTAHSGLFDMVWTMESGYGDGGEPAVYYATTGGAVCASFDAGDSWRTIAAGLGTITHLKPVPIGI